MKPNTSIKMIMIYLLAVFTISSVFYVLIFRGGGLETGSGQVLVLPLMWSPGIAALLTAFILQRNIRGLGWGFGKPRYYLVAYLLPLIYAGSAYALVWIAGLGRPDFSLLGENPLMALLQGMTLGVLGAALLALGEEIGWRGLLIPQLARIQPFGRTAFITGAIWGLWHVPLIVGGGYSSYAPTWYAVICFGVLVIGMSFAFAWLRLASGSLWPAVLLHAVHNHFIQDVLDKITVDNGRTEFFTTEFGLGLAIMGLIFGLIFWRLGQRLDPAQDAVIQA